MSPSVAHDVTGDVEGDWVGEVSAEHPTDAMQAMMAEATMRYTVSVLRWRGSKT
jgi:hypothetical protein